MSDHVQAPVAPFPWLDRVTGWVAVLGGALALAVAGLVVVSILGRWLFNTPVEGDFEFVRMGAAIAVFTYLPYTQARRGNIYVDTFTNWMSPRARAIIDAGWDLAFAAFMALCAYGLFSGARDAMRTGETTMQLQLAVWPAIMLCATLCALLVLTSIGTAIRLLGAGRQDRS
jgi:TRAP-type C4-dicarboxylate transport system permease small subunit